MGQGAGQVKTLRLVPEPRDQRARRWQCYLAVFVPTWAHALSSSTPPPGGHLRLSRQPTWSRRGETCGYAGNKDLDHVARSSMKALRPGLATCLQSMSCGDV